MMAVRHSSSLSAVLRRATISLCGRQEGTSTQQCLTHASSNLRLHGQAVHSSSQPECQQNARISPPLGTSLLQSASQTHLGSCLHGIITNYSGSRTVHTSACILSSSDQPHITSRRGKLFSLEDAKRYVTSLSVVQRSTLEQALQEMKPDEDGAGEGHSAVERPNTNQLKLLCYQSALPFIGFGFLDNVIMITVGEYIDWTLGLTLGISTMAAAGLGNMISDLAGLGLADQVEAFCLRLGIPNPKLSSTQLKHKSSRWTILLGRCIGIVIGCTVGMAPLFWINDPRKANEDCTRDHNNK